MEKKCPYCEKEQAESKQPFHLVKRLKDEPCYLCELHYKEMRKSWWSNDWNDIDEVVN